MIPETTHAPRVTVRCPFCQTWNRVNSARVADRPKCGNCARPLLLDRPLALHDDDFAQTIASSEIPVLVDFYADWCGPCRLFSPVFSRVADKYGDIAFFKIDGDLYPESRSEVTIDNLPFIAAFRDGNFVEGFSTTVEAGLETFISRMKETGK